jgi:hypothetical protein
MTYECEKCGKLFNNKASYGRHCNKKKDCSPSKININETIPKTNKELTEEIELLKKEMKELKEKLLTTNTTYVNNNTTNNNHNIYILPFNHREEIEKVLNKLIQAKVDGDLAYVKDRADMEKVGDKKNIILLDKDK